VPVFLACLVLLFSSCAFVFAGAAPDENGAIASVQRLFDAMATHNASDAAALFTPGAALTAVRAMALFQTAQARSSWPMWLRQKTHGSSECGIRRC
jgi:hypothetical protein